MKSNHFHLYYSNKGKMLLPSTHKEAYQVALLNRSCFNNNDVSSLFTLNGKLNSTSSFLRLLFINPFEPFIVAFIKILMHY